MVSFRNLVIPGVGSMLLMASGLLGKAGGTMVQTMKVRVPDSVGCASHRLQWQGIGGIRSQPGSSWGPRRPPSVNRMLLGSHKAPWNQRTSREPINGVQETASSSLRPPVSQVGLTWEGLESSLKMLSLGAHRPP